jgi:hypothetical protein
VGTYSVTAKSWTDTGSASFTRRTSSVTFVGGGTINSDDAFHNVILQGSANTISNALRVWGNWTNNMTGALTVTGSTVTFNGSAGVQQLSGSSTFYALKALTSGATLQFTAGTTQYVTNAVEFQNVSLKSTTDNATWYFVYSGSSQTLTNLRVKDSNAGVLGGQTMTATASTDLGNNTNWVFPAPDAGVRYWIATGTSTWSTAGNWSTSSGGPATGGVPVSSHTVVFDANSKGNPIVTGNITIASMTISGSTATINTNGYTVTISSAFTQSSGTIQLSTSTILIGSSMTVTSAADFQAQNSTVSFNGAGAQSISGGTTFYNLLVDNTHASPSDTNDVDPLGSIVVQNILTVNDGQFQPANNSAISTITINTNGILKPDSTAVIYSSGNWTNAGTFDSASGPVIDFNRASGVQFLNSGGTSGNFQFTFLTHSGAGTLRIVTSNLVVGNLLVNSNGTFDAATDNRTVTAAGATISGGSFLTSASGLTSFSVVGLTISGGSLTGSTGDMTIGTGAFLMTGGTFTAPTGTFIVSSNWTRTGGNFIPGTSTVTFTRPAPQFVSHAGGSFNTIRSSVTNSGGLTFSSSFTAAGFIVDAAALGSAATVYFAGNSTFTISTFTITGSGSNVVVLKSTDAAQWRLNNTSQFSVSGVDVSSSNAIGNAIIAYNSINRGNNTNWIFPVDSGIRYWIATGTSSWNSAANWSTISGGPATGGVPTSTHTVVFDANSKGNALMYSNVTVATITISGSTATIKTQSYDLTLSSGYSQSSGRIELGTSVVTMQGTNWAVSGGVFDAGTSTVQFKLDSTTSTILSNGTSFYHLVLDTATISTPGVLKLLDRFYVLGNLTLNKGTFDNQLSSSDIKVAGDVTMTNFKTNLGQSTWTVSGNWNHQGVATLNSYGSLTILNGAGKTVVGNYLTTKFGNLLISGTITNPSGFNTTISANSTVTVSGTLTLTNGLIFYNEGDLKVTSSGRISGSGFLQLDSGVPLTQQDGIIDVAQLNFVGNHDQNISTATYNSALVAFGNNSSTMFTPKNGTYRFTGNVQYTCGGGAYTYTVNNSVANPTWIIEGNVAVNETSCPVIWTKGTGSIFFSSNTVAQQVNFLGKSVERIVSSNTASGGLTFTSSFTAAGFLVDSASLGSSATVYFAGNSTFTISTFTIAGSGSNIVTLKSTDTAKYWYLNNTNRSSVVGVRVSSSNASAGQAIYAVNSVNLGQNVNWNFSNGKVWNGAGANELWNTGANWVGGSAPGSTDIALFDGNYSVKNSSINVDANVAGIQINANYTGTITQNTTNTITLGATGYIQAGGRFNGGAGTIDMNGNYSLSGGSFTASSGTWTHGYDFTVTGGSFSHNLGTIYFDTSNNKTITAGTAVLNQVQMGVGGGGWVYTISGTLPVASTFTFNSAGCLP